jgi:hypothetical protein
VPQGATKSYSTHYPRIFLDAGEGEVVTEYEIDKELQKQPEMDKTLKLR